MTPEALLLSTLDDLEAKFQTVRNEFAAGLAAGRAADQVSDWVRSMERNVFDSKRYVEQFEDASAVGSAAATDANSTAQRDPAPAEDVPAFTLRVTG